MSLPRLISAEEVRDMFPENARPSVATIKVKARGAGLCRVLGRPYTANGFGNAFRAWCNEAGLPHCSAHGLRKAGASFSAENGATEAQLKAMFGWRTLSQAALYTRAARQAKIAHDSMHLIAPRNPTDASTQSHSKKQQGKSNA